MRKTSFKKLGFIIVAGLLFATIAPFPSVIVNAAENSGAIMQLSPVKDRQKLTPGQKFEGSFNINNTGTAPFDFHVYVQPFSIGENCVDNYEVPDDFTTMTKWVTFDQQEYEGVQPGASQAVTFHVDVPDDAPAGGQYVVIFAETGDSGSAGGSAVKVNKRIGYKFYAYIEGENRESGKVKSVEQSQFYWQGPVESESKVYNDGNVDFTATHIYKITDLFGKEAMKPQEAVADVLPSSCRIMNQKWEGTPGFGLFWVTNEIKFFGKVQFSETKLVLVVPVWFVLLMIVVIGLLIWAIVLCVKQRSHKKMKKKS